MYVNAHITQPRTKLWLYGCHQGLSSSVGKAARWSYWTAVAHYFRTETTSVCISHAQTDEWRNGVEMLRVGKTKTASTTARLNANSFIDCDSKSLAFRSCPSQPPVRPLYYSAHTHICARILCIYFCGIWASPNAPRKNIVTYPNASETAQRLFASTLVRGNVALVQYKLRQNDTSLKF